MRKNMPQMQNGTKSFGGREILHGMNLSVERGIIYGLLGVNGDGKSTAFKFVLKSIHDDMNEFESTGEEYFQAICDIKGASKLNQLMRNDGNQPLIGR